MAVRALCVVAVVGLWIQIGGCGGGGGKNDCDPGYAGPDCTECADGFHRDAGGNCVPDEECMPYSCSYHGTCDDATGEVICTCDPGYAGSHCDACADGYHRDANGECVTGGERCQPDSCNGHGTCDDSTGRVVCFCDTGYAGQACERCAAGYHDEAGRCVPDTGCTASSCSGHGICDDASGEVRCTCETGYTGKHCESCATGYHDDGSGNCVPGSGGCEADTCNYHGSCSQVGDELVCSCYQGYIGQWCDACAAGYHDDGQGRCVADTRCNPDTCSGHGTCDDSSGAIVCTCEPGYAGDFCQECAAGYHRDANGKCVADAGCAADSCNGHGTCDDSQGYVVCTCESGYGGQYCERCAPGFHQDASGACVEDENCRVGTCNRHGTCDDTGGVVVCTCEEGYAGDRCEHCADGYTLDDNNRCVPTEGCSAVTCNGHGTCDDSSGVAVCTCDAGYTGDRCDQCAAGYHPDGNDCIADQTCKLDSCNRHGTCDDSSGTIVCTCDTGYAGETCDRCAAGYMDNGNGQCIEMDSCQPDSCNHHGTCDDSSGQVVCSCEAGYTGDHCDQCAAGYHDDGAGNCLPDESCQAGSCSHHGTCDDSSGAVVCTCDPGYAGPDCSQCAAGHHDDGAGNCVADEACQPSSCNHHGTCDDSSGAIVCTCDAGYTGPRCAQCAAGYHDDGAGNCIADSQCGPDSCNGHGLCDDSSGTVVCTCEPGYTGSHCDACSAGYHDDGTGNCVADSQCGPDSCSGHGTCDDSSGAIVCTCDEGYAGANCDQCAAGYHDDGNGCVPDSHCGPNSCNHHGVCDDSSGQIVCTCDAGYAGTYCASCAQDYHDDGNGNCVADEHCAAGSCSGHGTCEDSSGIVVCACYAGYTGDHCQDCAPGYHDDGAGGCVPDTSCGPDTCNGHGSCDDSSGQPVCTCDPGWTGAHCEECDVDYHLDPNGNCVPDQDCQPDSCSGHGTCDDSSGTIVCTCDPGYAGPACGQCAAGHHAQGDDCVPDAVCGPDTCNGHGECDDSSGQPVCTCHAGYVGPHCGSCAAGFHDDGTGTCLPDHEMDCADWQDDDGDGLTDCDDLQDCAGDPACPACDPQESIGCGDGVQGDTYAGFDGMQGYSCSIWQAVGPETVYSFQAAADTSVRVALGDLNADLDLYVLKDDCDPQQCVVYGDNEATFWATAGTTYFVVVDGYLGSMGSYSLQLDCDLTGEEICDDQIDNNDNWLIDCDDPACHDDPACQTHETCYDEVDNDGDGLTDCNDPDCTGDPACPDCTPVATLACGESYSGTNTGGPSVIDWYDCCPWPMTGPEVTYSFTPPVSEEVVLELAATTADVDLVVMQDACYTWNCITYGDSQASFQAQAGRTYYVVVDGYAGAEADFELRVHCGSQLVEICDDQVDNDFDGEVDCADYDCIGDPACQQENCHDGVDNNGDGLTDCADPDCVGDPACSDCVASAMAMCNQTVQGNNETGASIIDYYVCSPWQENGPEVAYKFVTDHTEKVTVTLSDNTVDLDLFLLEGTCDKVQCTDFGGYALSFDANPEQTYYIVVDGYMGASGDYALTIECAGTTGDEDCTNSIDDDGDDLIDCQDPDCENHPQCHVCTAVDSVACEDSITSTTSGGAYGMSSYSCAGGDYSGPELAFSFEAEERSQVTANLGNAASGLGVLVLESTCSNESCIAEGSGSVQFEAEPGRTYYLVVDGLDGAAGNFDLDVSCQSVTDEVCDNELDDDGDGDIDCFDDDCEGDPACVYCEPEAQIQCGDSVQGTNEGKEARLNDYSCAFWDESAPEAVYQLDVGAENYVTVTISDMMEVDLDLFILQDECLAEACIGAADSGSDPDSRTFAAEAGTTYFLAVDGFEGEEGSFTLTVECSENPECEDCDPNASCVDGQCVCNEGYEGDGHTCTLVCEDGNCDYDLVVLVEEGLEEELAEQLDRYKTDVEGEGKRAYVAVFEGGTAADLRTVLGTQVEEFSVEGAWLIGDLPAAWYEQTAFDSHEEFPCDLYFQDLDATWQDQDADGKFDGHGDLDFDIYVSRLTGTIAQLKAYFDKNHTYRASGSLTAVEGFVFVDDDWDPLIFHGEDFGLEDIYNTVDVYDWESESTRAQYLAKLTSEGGAQFVYQWIHASPTSLYIDEHDGYKQVTVSDIADGNHKGSFFNLFDCSATRFTETNLGMTYLTRTDYGLTAHGSTKVGGNYSPSTFHTPLANGKTWGESWKNWYMNEGKTDDAWWMGMCILGDPLITLKGDRAAGKVEIPPIPWTAEQIAALRAIMVDWARHTDVRTFEDYRREHPQFFEE